MRKWQNYTLAEFEVFRNSFWQTCLFCLNRPIYQNTETLTIYVLNCEICKTKRSINIGLQFLANGLSYEKRCFLLKSTTLFTEMHNAFHWKAQHFSLKSGAFHHAKLWGLGVISKYRSFVYNERPNMNCSTIISPDTSHISKHDLLIDQSEGFIL